MEKKRLFKILVGFALATALMQGLQASDPRFPGAGQFLGGPVPAAPAPEPSYLDRARSWAGGLARRAAASVASTAASSARAAVVTPTRSLFEDYVMPVNGMKKVATWAVLYAGAKGVEGVASKSNLLLPVLAVAKLARYGAFAMAAHELNEAMPKSGTPGGNGIVVKKEGDFVASVPGLWTAAKVGAIGAAVSMAPVVLWNTVTRKTGTHDMRNFIGCTAGIAVAHGLYKAYKELGGLPSSVTTGVRGALSAATVSSSVAPAAAAQPELRFDPQTSTITSTIK